MSMITIGTDTVKDEVGICYYDPIEEKLLEINTSSGYIMGADSHTSIIHKLYLVTNGANDISKVKISLKTTDEASLYFTIKILPESTQPSIDSFKEIPAYNSATIVGPIQPHTLIPFFILVECTTKINTTVRLPIELEYDY